MKILTNENLPKYSIHTYIDVSSLRDYHANSTAATAICSEKKSNILHLLWINLMYDIAVAFFI